MPDIDHRQRALELAVELVLKNEGSPHSRGDAIEFRPPQPLAQTRDILETAREFAGFIIQGTAPILIKIELDNAKREIRSLKSKVERLTGAKSKKK